MSLDQFGGDVFMQGTLGCKLFNAPAGSITAAAIAVAGEQVAMLMGLPTRRPPATAAWPSLARTPVSVTDAEIRIAYLEDSLRHWKLAAVIAGVLCVLLLAPFARTSTGRDGPNGTGLPKKNCWSNACYEAERMVKIVRKERARTSAQQPTEQMP
jgi:hypothetical protein